MELRKLTKKLFLFFYFCCVKKVLCIHCALYDCLNLQGGLQSTLRKVSPASVARLERIQKLSWQKLLYWMMAIMTAQQVNMVNWGKEWHELNMLKLRAEYVQDCTLQKYVLPWLKAASNCLNSPDMSINCYIIDMYYTIH